MFGAKYSLHNFTNTKLDIHNLVLRDLGQDFRTLDAVETHHKDPDDGADGLVLLDESVELSDPGGVVIQNLFTGEF